MVSVFNLEQLQEVLKDFYRITRIRITVFDSENNELVSYPESCPPFCALIRSTEQGRRACAKCDAEACAIAARKTKTHIYQCHAGLTEAIMPMYVGKVLVGYLLFGHVFAYPDREQGWQTIEDCCRPYPVPLETLREYCFQMPQISREYIASAARVLHMTASFLVLERMATLREDSAAAKLDTYLQAHFDQPLTAQTLCRELNIGRNKLFRLSRELYGCGICQQIRNLRMEKAKTMLKDHPDLSITQIATECGFSDYNYFISVFSQSVGMSPNLYRRQK